MPICEITGEEHCSLHEHHVIPREFGGIDGPTVHISPSLHDAIHRSVHNTKLKARLLSSYTGVIRANIQMLLVAIETAETQLTKVNKSQIIITFNKQEEYLYDALEKLSEELNMSKTSLIKNMLTKFIKNK